MKKIAFILAIVAMMISSCGNKKQKESTSTHTHSDGSVHAGSTHGEAGDITIKQEAFEVEAGNDSTHQHVADENESGEHSHESGESHEHHEH